ncbi:MAG: protease [Micavibrio sp.]|nr:MAG: protease [Micavibrio sp.]
MLMGAMVLISMISSFWIVGSLLQPSAGPSLPDDIVLFLKLDGGLSEKPAEANFAEPFGAGAPTVREMVNAIDAATEDPRVHGILARMNSGSFALAHIQELRTAIARFRDSGKFAYIYSSSYGEPGSGLGRYYLASSFEEIWMQPMGILTIGGIHAEMPFFRDTLDKIGVSPQFFQRKEYKSAYENLTRNDASPYNKEMMEALITDIKDEIVGGISRDRNIKPEQFEKLVDQGLFMADEAKEAGLINYSDYADELVGVIKELLTGDEESEDITFVEARQYAGVLQAKKQENLLAQKVGKSKPKIALIYAVGAIMPSGSGGGPGLPGAGGVAAADEIAPAILDAADDESVKAVVLRIDSPGGSPTASESILRAVERVQEKGKPVIVSMGPTAASGGYWIAAYADQIFVLPTTITGSIGVVGGKFYMQDLWAKLGVNWDGVKWGQNSGMWSLNTPFSETESERVNAMLDQVYNAFITRVAKGRNMSTEDVDKIAKGRVWSGKSALEIGLADQLGGLTEALDYAAESAGFEDRSKALVQIMPKPKTPIEQFIELFGDQVALGQNMKWQKSLVDFAAPFTHQMNVMQNPDLYSVYEPLVVD